MVNGVQGLDVFIEQPCLSYEECRSVRERCSLPFILDESMDDIGMLVRILADRSADAINLVSQNLIIFLNLYANTNPKIFNQENFESGGVSQNCHN